MVGNRIRTSINSLLHHHREEDSSYIDYFYDNPGDLPGTLEINPSAPHPVITLIDYTPEEAIRQELAQPEDITPYLDSVSVSWVDVKGLGSEEILQRVGTVFQLHPLVLEDVVNVPQRPKVEEHGDQLLIVARMVTLHDDHKTFESEQVSFVLGKYYLLTVQEEPRYDCFGPIRERIRTAKGAIRRNGPDYLTYALLDSIIDGFFPVLEVYGEQLEALEDEVVAKPTPQTLQKIHDIKRELLTLRRAIWPQRDAINTLIRDGSDLISSDVRVYLRDCYDHAIQVLDMVETYREIASSLMDVYLSSVSNRMNEIMKFLTVMSSIFIPLTFIAGIYGMNFNTEKSPYNMPELNTYWGYPLCLGVMGGIAIALMIFFWHKGWFADYSSIKDSSHKDSSQASKPPKKGLFRKGSSQSSHVVNHR